MNAEDAFRSGTDDLEPSVVLSTEGYLLWRDEHGSMNSHTDFCIDQYEVKLILNLKVLSTPGFRSFSSGFNTGLKSCSPGTENPDFQLNFVDTS